MNNPFHEDFESMQTVSQSGDFTDMLDKLYSHHNSKGCQQVTGVQSFREKIENLLPSMTKLFSSSINPQVQKLPSFIDCWTSTATSAGQSSRTRVLNIMKDGKYTFWEELIMEPGVGIESSCEENNKPKRRGSLGKKTGPPKFRIRKSSGEWMPCVKDGVTLILLRGVGSELSGECGDYEEDISPRGNSSVTWTHVETIEADNLMSDWSSVEHDKVTELLC